MRAFLRSPSAAYVLLPVATMAWAGNHVVARSVAGLVPPASMSTVRWLLVTLLIGVFAHAQIRGDWETIRANASALIFLGVVGAGIFGTLQYVALQYTTAMNIGVVGSVGPAFIVLASFLLFGERLRMMQLMGIGVSLVGVLAIVSRLHPELLGSLRFNRGDVIVIGNLVLWAIYSACLRLRPAIGTMSFMFTMAVVSLVCNVPFALWEHASGFVLRPIAPTFVAILYSAFVTTLLAYYCWNKGVELVGAARAGVFMHLSPIFGAVLAVSILGEHIELYHIVGFVLILSGVTLAARPSGAITEPEARG